MTFKKNLLNYFPIVLVVLGIAARIFYAGGFGADSYADYKNYSFFQYTHDTLYHVEYIQFVADHLSLPPVEKGLEYPQQPLYYIFSGVLYNIINVFSLEKMEVSEILKILVWLSCIFSIGTLVFAYFLAKKITESAWLQSFITGIIAFTPAFIYQAGMLGNDPFSSFLSAGAFFYLICYIKKEGLINFVLATLFSVLSFFSKATAGILLIMILVTVIYKYWKQNKSEYLKMAFSILIIGIACLAVSLYRAYIPSTGEFRFVESYTYEYQKTDPSRLTYFITFNVPELLKEGQSFVFGNEKVARTLPTFLYGSFVFGEYSFENITKPYPLIKNLMQIILLLGLLFPLGIIANLFYFKKWDIIDYISGFGILLNLILLVSFFLKYSAVCNSDFRYFGPMFLGVLAFSGNGLSKLNEKLKNKRIIPVLVFSLITLEILWVAIRIYIRFSANI
jgi:hypothetical protein